jgi:NAD+ kinase
MRIGIYGREFEPEFRAPISAMLEDLLKRNIELVVHDSFIDYLHRSLESPHSLAPFSDSEVASLDMLISIGGDGTILSAISVIRDSGVPILGVNTGRLGFLSNFPVEELHGIADALESGEYDLDERALLSVEANGKPLGNFSYALNEVTLHKKDTSSMITVHAWIDDRFMNSYWADGLIVSTATGSTAYSLSCGGPIVMPGSENILLTPIAPHNLNVRPMVVPNKNSVRLRAEGRDSHFLLTLDSTAFTVDGATDVHISRANFDVKLVILPGYHFFNTIRQKLSWGIDKRN